MTSIKKHLTPVLFWVLMSPFLIYSWGHIASFLHSPMLSAPFVLLFLVLSIVIQSLLWGALLLWGIACWYIEYLAIQPVRLPLPTEFATMNQYLFSGIGFVMVFFYTVLLVGIAPRLRVSKAVPVPLVSSVQVAPVQNIPPKCLACRIHPIENTHYQLCAGCKKKYAHEIQRVRSQKYRARVIGEPATLTIGEWVQTLQAFRFLCAYCQLSQYAVMEHYIPMGHGVGTTKENCIPACVTCNAKKYNKHPER